jgi:hypothetical protein
MNIEKTKSCKNTILDSIRVMYYNYNYDFESIRAKHCNDIQYDNKVFFKIIQPYIEGNSFIEYTEQFGVIDSLITDCNILSDIEREIYSLCKSDSAFSMEARMLAQIYFKNGTCTQLCISAYEQIYYDGIPQKYNFQIIDKIRKHTGYYLFF